MLQFVAQWAGDRLSVAEIEDLADTWLTGPEIVRLDVDRHDARTGDAIRRQDGRTVPAIALDDLYTTRTILAMEEAISAGYRAGRSAGVAAVDPDVVERVLAERPHLGQDQADMVRAITTSGQRIQLIRGDAGAGKTTALEAAARAWEAAGYNVIGCAVQGTASEIVADNVKVPSATVASLLARVQMGDASIGPRTVVLVDECSTLGNRDFYRLVRALDQTGASARLAGDPRQHTAVAAGGAWRRLLAQYPDDVPAVTKVWRQSGTGMADVRQALAQVAGRRRRGGHRHPPSPRPHRRVRQPIRAARGHHRRVVPGPPVPAGQPEPQAVVGHDPAPPRPPRHQRAGPPEARRGRNPHRPGAAGR